jgi:hypothetical protein
VDTSEAPRPKDLRGDDWEKIEGRVLAVVDALVPRLKGRTNYFLVGNEIGGYFKSHKREIKGFTRVWKKAAARIKELVPGAQVSTTVSFHALGMLEDELKDLNQAIDYVSMTYYPLAGDFTMRPVRDVGKDFAAMLRTAGSRRLLIQEVGYSSSPINKSSPEQQADFYGAVFDQLEAHRGRIIGANFLFMSDLADSVVKEFGKYYRMPNAKNFLAYLKYLGVFDDKNRPKPAWEVYKRRAPALTN